MEPVFIAGLDRSGKTYMRFMLTSGLQLAISRRTDLWPRFYQRFGDLNTTDNLERCLTALLDYKHIRSLNLDLARLRADFELGPRTYERLFTLIHVQYARQAGKPRWGDQSELLERYASNILAAYPEARIIHMLRDPRDRYYAVLGKSRRRGGVGIATARWLLSASLAERHQRTYPDRYRVVCYEDMVRAPEKTLRAVCSFIGEEFRPDMLKMESAARFAQSQTDEADSALTPLSTEYIGQFQGHITRFEIAFIETFSHALMQNFGYEPLNVEFSLLENLPGLTVNAARLAGWRLLNQWSG